MISEDDIAKVVAEGRGLPPSAGVYVEEDFVMNLLETVLDYMLQTTVVVKALEHFREQRSDDVRGLDDLERLLAAYPDDRDGNTSLAEYLWGHKLWTRAQQLRELTRFFRIIWRRRQRASASVGARKQLQARLLRPDQRARAGRLPVARDAPRRRHCQARRPRPALR